MTDEELHRLLQWALELPAETECLEFKEVKQDNFDFNKLGKYFSALSNEANLKNKECSWLIFGIQDKTRKIIGTNYKPEKSSLDKLKAGIAEKTNGRITFQGIYEITEHGKRILMFQVPPAPQGIPTSWEGHYYGREGESLSPLSMQEIEQIRKQALRDDWSAHICKHATIEDLDIEAIDHAKHTFKEKNRNQSFANEIDEWDISTFLDKAKITRDGKITRTAIILLGKSEAAHHLSPANVQITWKLDTYEQSYKHFGPPFLLTTNEVYQKIRNTKYKFHPRDGLFPIELDKYEPWVIFEALNNCIAHQDYTKQGRILLTEKEDELIFTNAGNFFEGTVKDYVLDNKTPQSYRNLFLAQAMVQLNMIDTMGYGIKKMYQEQRKRFLPMPQYDLTNPEQVTLKIYGKVKDENYTRLLIRQTSLSFETVIYLDKIQKKEKLSREEFSLLKKQGLVEGRYPNIFISSTIASITDKKSGYIKNRAFDDGHYKKMVISLLKKFEEASRKEIDELLMDKLSDALSSKQKKQKINNLLQEMARKDGTIKNIGSRKKPVWTLTAIH